MRENDLNNEERLNELIQNSLIKAFKHFNVLNSQPSLNKEILLNGKVVSTYKIVEKIIEGDIKKFIIPFEINLNTPSDIYTTTPLLSSVLAETNLTLDLDAFETQLVSEFIQSWNSFGKGLELDHDENQKKNQA